jgi:enamine deaminase RidA (YjgF/YER057c/UK114 family)
VSGVPAPVGTPGPLGSRIRGDGPYEDLLGYARAVVLPAGVGIRVIVSGSTAAVDGAVRHPGDAYRQALTAFEVIERALREAGATLAHVVRTRMYVVGRSNCAPVGRAHREQMAPARPAATMVLVAGLIDEAMLVEVEAEAVLVEVEAEAVAAGLGWPQGGPRGAGDHSWGR